MSPERTINEGDEPPCHILLTQSHRRNIRNEDGFECASDLDIVRSAQRLAAQLLERKARSRASTFGDAQFATPNIERSVGDHISTCGRRERFKELLDLRLVLWR